MPGTKLFAAPADRSGTAISVFALAPPAFAQAWGTSGGAPGRDVKAVAGPAEATDGEGSWSIPILHGLGVMAGMRLGEVLLLGGDYANAGPDFIAHRYDETFTEPPLFDTDRPAFEWDGDEWYTNVIGHGLFGSELYLRARTCRKSALEGFVFAAAGSTLWEYAIEANAVQPSAQDLVYTPIMGVILGELRYQGHVAARRWGDRGWGNVIKAVLDPLGELERAAGTQC